MKKKICGLFIVSLLILIFTVPASMETWQSSETMDMYCNSCSRVTTWTLYYNDDYVYYTNDDCFECGKTTRFKNTRVKEIYVCPCGNSRNLGYWTDFECTVCGWGGTEF